MKNKKIRPEFNKQELKHLNDLSALLYISQEVYNARVNLGLSQQALASLVGTTQRIISNIENAEINIGFNLLKRLAESLQIPLIFGSYKAVSSSEFEAKIIMPIVSDYQAVAENNLTINNFN